MKKIIALSLPMALLIASSAASAFWGYDSQRAQAQSFNENREKIDGRGNGSAEIDMDCDWAAKGKSGGNGLFDAFGMNNQNGWFQNNRPNGQYEPRSQRRAQADANVSGEGQLDLNCDFRAKGLGQGMFQGQGNQQRNNSYQQRNNYPPSAPYPYQNQYAPNGYPGYPAQNYPQYMPSYPPSYYYGR